MGHLFAFMVREKDRLFDRQAAINPVKTCFLQFQSGHRELSHNMCELGQIIASGNNSFETF